MAVQRMLRDGYSEAVGEYGTLKRKKERLEDGATRIRGSELFFGAEVIVLASGGVKRVVWRSNACATAALTD